MDLLINPAPANSTRISNALTQLGLQGHSPNSFAKHGLQVPLKQQYYAELLTPRLADPPYSKVSQDPVDAKVFGIPVRVAPPARLIQMKQQAAASLEGERGKHLRDIELLEHVL